MRKPECFDCGRACLNDECNFHLNILIIGSTKEIVQNALTEILKNECSPIRIRSKERAELQDGTTYSVASISDRIRGRVFDQIIVIPYDFNFPIDELKYTLRNLCVPIEFQIQDYDY